MKTIIPSILNGTTLAYCIHSDSDVLWHAYYRTTRPLNCHIGVFSTYGDGTIQHSGTSVPTAELFTDFCLSFGTWLMENPGCCDDGASPFYRGCLSLDRLPDDAVDFLAKIRHREDRRQWYSVSERKLTTTDKSNDRRYHRVDAGADGSIRAHLAHWFAGHTGTIDQLRYYTAAVSIFHRIGGTGWDELEFDRIYPGDHAQAWRGLMHALDMLEHRRTARNTLRCAKDNTERSTARLIAA